jgi:serine/threonine protein kinase
LTAMAKKKDLDDILEVLDEAESLLCDEDEQVVQDFREEFTVVKSMEHPNIVRLLAYTMTKEYEIPIYELMHWSLDDLLQFHNKTGTKLEHEKQIQFAVDIAQGMCYLHSREPPAFHGDLKPSNLLIDSSGTLKIADVGLAKIIPDVARGLQGSGHTAMQRYIAPELIRKEEFGPSADVYSFAMILFTLLDGRPPWPNMNGIKAATLAAERGERPELDDKWDPRLRLLISECWKGEPTDRPNFEKMLSNLTEYQDDSLSTRSSSLSSFKKRQLSFLRKTKSPHHQPQHFRDIHYNNHLETPVLVKKRIGSLLLKRRTAAAATSEKSCKSKQTVKTLLM